MADAGAPPAGGETYASAGVDIDAGEEAVRRIAPHVRTTYRPEVLGDVGGFGALFRFPAERFRDPVLVSSTDGVGTKLEVARLAGRFDTVGVDLVAMCADDIVCQGAEPLLFLDYLAVGALDPAQVESVVAGMAEGCRQAGCALIGGEMAEHPGVMAPGAVDLAGFVVGVVERSRLLPAGVAPGDVLVGMGSPNLRSNGFSLARRVLLARAGLALHGPAWPGAAHSLADELLAPSVVYAPHALALRDAYAVRALAHVTGGGIPGNLPRVLPDGCRAVVRRGSWAVPRIFTELQRLGSVTDDEMARVFNMGVGMVAVVAPGDADAAVAFLIERGIPASVIGTVEPGEAGVSYVG